ncbi:MAG TPA: radical SAM protein [Thermodesulfovibrionales bacterium]|nr:radical SAM protein [Thermodesulfovibrionales bacterium]
MVGYLKISAEELNEKILDAEELLKECVLCPRRCHVDRTAGENGFCRVLNKPFVASWGPHFGEERPLVGRFGSGTIFFSFCNLGCIFCQNWTISHEGEGAEVSFERLAAIMVGLQDMGCHNINLVTPTHQMPMILRSLALARDQGLSLPVVYNCGGYESPEALSILDGVIDIYMPDIKYADAATALRYSKARDYPEAAKAAIREMHRQVGDLIIDERGIAKRGLLVRHLVLPENGAGTEEIVRFLSEEISRNTYLNIMDQYHPCYKAYENPPLDRRITNKEYKAAIDLALKAGMKRIDGVTV